MKARFFGPFNRFKLTKTESKIYGVEYFVTDAEAPDPRTKEPQVVARESTEAEAIRAAYRSIGQ